MGKWLTYPRTRTWNRYRLRAYVVSRRRAVWMFAPRSNVRADPLNTGAVDTASLVVGNTVVLNSAVAGGYLLPGLATYVGVVDQVDAHVASILERSVSTRDRLVMSYEAQDGGYAYATFYYTAYPQPIIKRDNAGIEAGTVTGHAVAKGRFLVYSYGGDIKVYDLENMAAVYAAQRGINTRTAVSYSDGAGAGAALYGTGQSARNLEVFTVNTDGSITTLFTADPRAGVSNTATVYPPAILDRGYGAALVPPTVLVAGYSVVDDAYRLLVFDATGGLAANIDVAYAPAYANGPVMLSDRLACTCAPTGQGASIVDIDAGQELCSVDLGASILDAVTDGDYVYVAVADSQESDVVKIDRGCNIVARLSQADENPVLPPRYSGGVPPQSLWLVKDYILVGGDGGVALYRKDFTAVAKNTDRPLTNIQVW